MRIIWVPSYTKPLCANVELRLEVTKRICQRCFFKVFQQFSHWWVEMFSPAFELSDYFSAWHLFDKEGVFECITWWPWTTEHNVSEKNSNISDNTKGRARWVGARSAGWKLLTRCCVVSLSCDWWLSRHELKIKLFTFAIKNTATIGCCYLLTILLLSLLSSSSSSSSYPGCSCCENISSKNQEAYPH